MKRLVWCLGMALTPMGFVGQSAWARDTAAEGDQSPILVTGLREASASITGSHVSPLRYPQSVTVMNAQMLEKLGATRLDNALDLAGGVARQNDFGGLWDKYSVRGFAGDENSEPDIMVNRFSNNFGYNAPIDTATVERFEFLKGAAAALSGRGEPGGSLNIVTKAPPTKAEAQASLSYGSWHNRRLTGDVGGALTNTVSARLIGVSEAKDSFRNYVHSNRELIAPSLAFKPSEQLRFLYQAEYMRNRTPLDRGVVALGGNALAMDRRTFLGEPGDGRIDQKSFWQQGSMFAALSDAASLELGLSQRQGSLQGFSTQADFGARGLQADGRTIGRTRRYHDFHWNNLTARAELTAKFTLLGVANDMRVGVDRVRHGQSQIMLQARGTATAPILTIDALDPVYGKTTSMMPTLQNFRDGFASESVYAQDLLTRGDFTLLLGGRWNSFRESMVNHLSGDLHLDTRNQGFTPRAALTWNAARGLAFYTSWGRSIRLNPSDGISTFDPEKSESKEVGVKYSLFGKALTGQASLFDMTKRNVLNPNASDPFVKTQIGRQRSRGVETEATLNLRSGLFVTATYTYLDATVENDKNTALIGTRLSNVPNHMGSIYAAQDLGRVTLGGGVTYVGQRNGDPYASGYMLPGYVIARANATLRVNRHVDLRFDLDNIFDKHYAASSYANVWTTPGAPRSWRITLDAKL